MRVLRVRFGFACADLTLPSGLWTPLWGECQNTHIPTPPHPQCPLQPQDGALGAAGPELAAFGVSWEMAQGAVGCAGGYGGGSTPCGVGQAVGQSLAKPSGGCEIKQVESIPSEGNGILSRTGESGRWESLEVLA